MYLYTVLIINTDMVINTACRDISAMTTAKDKPMKLFPTIKPELTTTATTTTTTSSRSNTSYPQSRSNSYQKHNSYNEPNEHKVFTPVSYRQFRQHLADIPSSTIKGQGFETAIYDKQGDIQAIVHAASIDNNGRCYPAEYFIRTSALSLEWHQAA